MTAGTAVRESYVIVMLPPDIQSHLKAIVKKGRVYARSGPDLSPVEFEDFGKDRLPIDVNHEYVALPGDTDEVAQLVRYAVKHKIPLTPSGGRTGLTGGSAATQGGIVVSMGKMSRILHFDASIPALTVEAGVITRTVQDEAEKNGFYFPVDFASAGSSQIGGNAATNAGGIHVIRYGSMRNYVLAMTVVTGSGEVLRLGAPVLKDNTGYDLKNLFVGSEGTLGIITELTLRLVPPPKSTGTILLGMDDFAQVIRLFQASLQLAQPVRAFECFDRTSLSFVRDHVSMPPPFLKDCGWHVVLEVEDAADLETAAGQIAEAADVDLDQVRTGTGSRAGDIWRYRESISESLSPFKPHKYDVSIPVSRMEEFVRILPDTVLALESAARIVIFGHVGDGNLHVNLILPVRAGGSPHSTEAVDNAVYGLVTSMRGSISAEHGIGLLKREALAGAKPPAELTFMRGIKAVFDPAGILNPGKIFV
ncbi:MAG: FAD-binding oxidoreductase [Spirochaetia bacterium]|nr:FAD-binding oxidoreductase [Spirochaetia bacterium]